MSNIASPWRRLIAFAIDKTLWLLYFITALSWLSASDDIPTTLNRLLVVLVGYLILFSTAYEFINLFLISWAGGTIGKLVTGMAIVRPDGKHVSFARAFLRNYIGYMVSGIFFLGFIWVLIDKSRRGWHDQLADTYVVVTHRFGWIVGLIALVLIGYVNVSFVRPMADNFSSRRSMYTSFFVSIYDEFKPTPKTQISPAP